MTGNRGPFCPAPCRECRGLARAYLGKLDDVIDQIGVLGLSVDFIYMCFPWSLLL